LPETEILASLSKTRRFVIAEDVCEFGCVGNRVLALCAKYGIALKGAKLLNLGSGVVGQGTREQLLREHGLDAASIAVAAISLTAAVHAAQGVDPDVEYGELPQAAENDPVYNTPTRGAAATPTRALPSR